MDYLPLYFSTVHIPAKRFSYTKAISRTLKNGLLYLLLIQQSVLSQISSFSMIPRKHILPVSPYILFPRSQSVPEPVLQSRTGSHRLCASTVN